MADTLSECLNKKKESVLVTSTGVIGVYLPMDKIILGIKETSKTLGSDEKSAKRCAKAIMTTDTFRKEIAVEIDIKGKKVKLAGNAKGKGMINENMATMLGCITTDIKKSQALVVK